MFLINLSCNVNVNVLMFFDDGEDLFDLCLVVTATLVDQLPLRLQIKFVLMSCGGYGG